MVFMQDSERAAELAKENNISVGLHLNLTQEFTGNKINPKLKIQHNLIRNYLKARKINQFLFNPLLQRAFDFVFMSQWDEFCRLYGNEPTRLDGHHHMHLCINMLLLNKYPKGIKIRRNFTFISKEKSSINRFYRYLLDRYLKSRFQCSDYFFSLQPIKLERLKKIISLSDIADVEIMVHPGIEEEYNFLMSEEWAKMINKYLK
jgi:predicted glycoside hydrolase/deacetylase ChbG (UPF0249 family)